MADKKKTQAAGDAPDKKKDEKGKGKGKDEIPEPEEIPKTPSQIAREEAEYRAMMRKQRFKRRWPEITKVAIKTRRWRPPPPPARLPPVVIERPALTTRRWVPPQLRRRRRPRPRYAVPRDQITQPLYECAKLKKIWNNFVQVEKNKMILRGSVGCDSKKYSSTTCGAQTACVAVACRALLARTPPEQLRGQHVDELVAAGDHYYRRCMRALKCYKGKPQLQLKQLLTNVYLGDTRYTVKMTELERGLVAKHPDSIQNEPDFLQMLEKRAGSTFMFVATLGDRHFLVWGHPPSPDAHSSVRTVCYVLDPHMLDELGNPDKLHGVGAFLRFAGVSSLAQHLISHYGDLEAASRHAERPAAVLTDVEVVQVEAVPRAPTYELDLKALHAHCRSEWESMHVNALLDKKIYEGKYPQCSLSAVSLATSRASARSKLRDFYRKTPKEPAPQLPMAPEKGPTAPTIEQLMQLRGEDFFLYCPRPDAHTHGRDEMLPRPRSEVVLHSAVAVAERSFNSQYRPPPQQQEAGAVLRATRHMASYRYQVFKTFTAIPCCVAALGMLRRLRARAWNEDVLDETLDLGYNLYRESLVERGGPIRRIVLGELKDSFRIRDQDYYHKERGIAVWGRLVSGEPAVLDLCRGIDQFFKEADEGLLQVPGEYEVAIWNEGGLYYMYHPWPADHNGYRVGLQAGGRACVVRFATAAQLCEHFLTSASALRRKPFSISEVAVWPRDDLPQPFNQLAPVAPGRWVLRGRMHEADARFPEERRGRQATPAAVAALALALVTPAPDLTRDDVDEMVVRGDELYQLTLDHLDKLGISLDAPNTEEEEEGEGDEGEPPNGGAPPGSLAAAEVVQRFRVTDYHCAEMEVVDCAYVGQLHPEPGSGLLSLKESLAKMFKEYSQAVVTARGTSLAVWRHDDAFYMFDPHACDEKGYPSPGARAAACIVRTSNLESLADAALANLPPAPSDAFNISPVLLTVTALRPELGAPETVLESKAYQWLNKGTAAILLGPRGENSAIGKAAEKAGVGAEDMAGRRVALAAAAAYCAAAAAVPPPHMHHDHAYSLLEAGAEYCARHEQRTGQAELTVEELKDKFEMGANTFTVELGEPVRLPLRLPDKPAGEGEEEEGEGGGGDEEGEELEGEETEPPMKEMKDLLFKMWYDSSRPQWTALLLGDYHQLGVWMAPGGRVVAFDPAPTLAQARLTPQRIQKGDELRLQRIKDEMAGEGGDEPEEEDEEVGAEGEHVPEPEPQYVPPESCTALMVFSSPAEFIDKLVSAGPLDAKQAIAPYKLYPVTVTNELTALLREKAPRAPPAEGDEAAADEEEEEALVDPLPEEAIGAHYTQLSRGVASVRGRVAQNEAYFLEYPNRDRQDAANAVMGIVVDHIEPHVWWKPPLVDAILKYGDRLHSASLHRASGAALGLRPVDLSKEFRVTSFQVWLEVDDDVVRGELSAGPTGPVLDLNRGLTKFFENSTHGVVCCKGYCVGVWRGPSGAYALWEPHASGPTGRASPGGAAALVLFATLSDLADTVKSNVERLARAGANTFSVSAVRVRWELARGGGAAPAPGAVPDEGYECKVLTGYVEVARGRTILRGSRPPDLVRFAREAAMQSACGAVAAACASQARRAALWTRRTVDDVMAAGCRLFEASVRALGYEFRPGDDVLLPLQVVNRFVLGVNYVRYDLQQVFTGRLEQAAPTDVNLRSALERFFEGHSLGVLWAAPHAAAVWRAPPAYYLMEPHACGPTGLRIDAQDDGAACVLTFTSPKMMAYAYLQNVPVAERYKRDFQLYAMAVNVQPIKKLGAEPPLVRAPPGVALVPATSKVGVTGSARRADEAERAHPPGGPTCQDAQRAADARDKDDGQVKGQRNTSGWLVLADGSQYLSAHHSMACRRFPYASRGNQAVACCVMAVAMSRVEDVCRWCASTLDRVLAAGDQLYRDSYLHYRPATRLLAMHQVLRKLYTPGNCVCRVLVYRPRHRGVVDQDLLEQLTAFFREERRGVLVAGRGDFAVALFRTPRGYYMLDPADRDRVGRAVAPPCISRARACFSQYPTVKKLAEKLGPNIPPVVNTQAEDEASNEKVVADGSKATLRQPADDAKKDEEKEVHFEEPAGFVIYGMDVTDLRRLDRREQ